MTVDHSIVRIYGEDGSIVAAGFLVSRSQVLTCAHVINNALGRRHNSSDQPAERVQLDFPLIAPGTTLNGRVSCWQPAEPEGGRDIAGLELVDSPPSGVAPIRLVRADDLWGHAFRALGFPAGYDKGVWASGVLRGPTADGWIQIEDIKEAGYRVEKGFSGTPVWDEKLEGVVGMVIAAEMRLGIRAAFCIPTDALVNAWPELASIVHDLSAAFGRLNNVPHLPPHFLSRPEHLGLLKSAILADLSEPRAVTATARRVCIHGMGGIGKSVLAAALARDPEVRSAFPDGVIWLTLGREPALTPRQAQLARALAGHESTFEDTQFGRAVLSNSLADKGCLVVLDDVWDARHVEPFDVLGPRCAMLLTTRNSDLVTTLGAVDCRLEALSHEQSLLLLAEWSKQDARSLPPEAAEVAKECGHLPLVLAMVGAMVRGSAARWANALCRLRSADIARIRQQLPDYPYPDLLSAIQVSVEALGAETRERYLDLSIFPEDTPVPERVLYAFWHPLGLDQFDVQNLVRLLVDHSLARQDQDGCLVLHDLQHDYVRNQAGDVAKIHDRFIEAYRPATSAWTDLSKGDPYIWNHLGYHLMRAGKEQELHQLVMSLGWLQAQQDVNPSLRVYAQDIARLLAAASQQEGRLPDLIALGLIRGTLTTWARRLSPAQVRAMVDSRQVELMLEWSERLTSSEWFRVDLIQAAGEVAAQADEREKAARLLKRAAGEVPKLVDPLPFQRLVSIAVDLLMLDDTDGLTVVQSIFEQMPAGGPLQQLLADRSDAAKILQEASRLLKVGFAGPLVVEKLGLEPDLAIRKLTDEKYMSGASLGRLYAAQEMTLCWAAFAEAFHVCGAQEQSHAAHRQAVEAVKLIDPNERDEEFRVLARLAELALAIGKTKAETDLLLDRGIESLEQYGNAGFYAHDRAFLASVCARLGRDRRAQCLIQDALGYVRSGSVTPHDLPLVLLKLAPCAHLVRDRTRFLASWIKDVDSRELVALAWRAYGGDASAAQAVLKEAATMQKGVDLRYHLVRASLEAIVPVLRVQTKTSPLVMAWLESCSRLLRPEDWLTWLARVLPGSLLPAEERSLLANWLKHVYAGFTDDSRATVGPYVAMPLGHLPLVDLPWVLSLFSTTFVQQKPYHRAVALNAIERFVPLLLRLGGDQVGVETWTRIQAVERLFDQSQATTDCLSSDPHT